MVRFAVDTTDAHTIVEIYPVVPRPCTVDPNCVAKYEVLTKFAKFAVETRFTKLAVETKLAKLAVETSPAKLAVEIKLLRFIEERYPAVPNPATVEVNWLVDKYPVVPKPITVLVKLVEVTQPVPTIEYPFNCKNPFVTVSRF